MGSDVLDESDASGNITDEFIFFEGKRIARRNVSSGNIYYYFADHLGTARVVTNATGAVPPVDDSDFYPFGAERPILSSSGNTYKFTGKERDPESGLDNFGARYFSSQYGRFMTPDWAVRPTAVPYAMFGDPQTLNLYGYVRNNPLSKSDIDGHCYPWCTVLGGFVAGGLIGGGGEIIAEKWRGHSIDWTKVKGSAIKGAIAGAVIGLAGPQAGVAATAALGAGGNVVGGIADRTYEGKSAKEVFSPTAVTKDAASGAIGGAIGGSQAGETAGEYVAEGSAKIAAASGDQATANFYLNNASAIGVGTAKAIDLVQSTAESYHDQTSQQRPEPPRSKAECGEEAADKCR
jgi:RHS repeat-associated protein